MKTHTLLTIGIFFLVSSIARSQNIKSSPEYIKSLTSEWTGERSADGRPKVPDNLLERLKTLTVEEAYSVLVNNGYYHQFEDGWMILHPDSVMTGRVVTAQFMPGRPDFDKHIRVQGKKENLAQKGGMNSWPIDVLTNGDVYVADHYDKKVNAAVIGDNLGNAIYSNSKRGVIFNGYVRDAEGLSEIEGFNAWIRGSHPSSSTFISSIPQQRVVTAINAPIRIAEVTVLPGDVVLAKKYGVVFIPPHLLELVVITGEITQLRDEFGHQRLREKKYLPGEIDSGWSEEIKKDFLEWLKNYPGKLPMSREELDTYLKAKN